MGISLRLSGGRGNTDPRKSIGGAMSNTAVGNDLFDTHTGSDVVESREDYRCVYLYNDASGPPNQMAERMRQYDRAYSVLRDRARNIAAISGYYGLAYVNGHLIGTAAYTDGRIWSHVVRAPETPNTALSLTADSSVAQLRAANATLLPIDQINHGPSAGTVNAPLATCTGYYNGRKYFCRYNNARKRIAMSEYEYKDTYTPGNGILRYHSYLEFPFNTGTTVHAIEVINEVAYLFDSSRIYAFDLRSRQRLRGKEYIVSIAAIQAVASDGKYLWWKQGQNWIKIWDTVNNKVYNGSPVFRSMSTNIISMAMGERFMYAAYAPSGGWGIIRVWRKKSLDIIRGQVKDIIVPANVEFAIGTEESNTARFINEDQTRPGGVEFTEVQSGDTYPFRRLRGGSAIPIWLRRKATGYDEGFRTISFKFYGTDYVDLVGGDWQSAINTSGSWTSRTTSDLSYINKSHVNEAVIAVG